MKAIYIKVLGLGFGRIYANFLIVYSLLIGLQETWIICIIKHKRKINNTTTELNFAAIDYATFAYEMHMKY